jgi:hypothetical protein
MVLHMLAVVISLVELFTVESSGPVGKSNYQEERQMTHFRCAFLLGLVVFASSAITLAQDGGFSKDERITPERLGLPKGNTRTSEPFVTRIYKTDDNDNILKKQPNGYPPFSARNVMSPRQNISRRRKVGCGASAALLGHLILVEVIVFRFKTYCDVHLKQSPPHRIRLGHKANVHFADTLLLYGELRLKVRMTLEPLS